MIDKKAMHISNQGRLVKEPRGKEERPKI